MGGEFTVPRGAAQQENLLNSKAGTSFGNAQNAYSTAMGGYQSMLNGTDTAALDPIASTYDSASANLYNTAARTRNNAGVTAGADQLARSKASSLSSAILGQREAALQGIAGLYGPSLSSASSLYGNATNAMEARPSVLQDVTGWAKVLTNPAGYGSPGGG